jgi:hypothetical protein
MTISAHCYLFVLSAFAIAAINSSFLLGQVVQIGPSDPNFCKKAEHIKPNLHVSTPRHISGLVVDQAVAPLKTSKVELRSYVSATQQMPVKITTTDADGGFDLGKVGPGKYRLLPSSTRAYEQPHHLRCPKEECRLAINLRANPTDLPLSVCPIR